ncbi:hypothetical protein RR48_11473 [Papilio machaon]|uniref:Ig-like domain-containing protein n=1 Tax=Papilio machaon TaxID=76193 RepID=A0A194QNP0_PAPMA|nr:hypothetical protein RR48_11473 [Papilio machaon]
MFRPYALRLRPGALGVRHVPVRWVGPARQWLACEAAGPRRAPPPPLIDDDRHKHKPYFWRRDGEKLDYKRVSTNGSLEVFHKRDVEGVYQCGVHHHRGVVLGKPVHLKFACEYTEFKSHVKLLQGVNKWQPGGVPQERCGGCVPVRGASPPRYRARQTRAS